MQFLISMVFVGMLALSSQAFGAEFVGAGAEKILREGKIVASEFTKNGHETRIWLLSDENRGFQYYACYSDFSVTGKLGIVCQNID